MSFGRGRGFAEIFLVGEFGVNFRKFLGGLGKINADQETLQVCVFGLRGLEQRGCLL